MASVDENVLRRELNPEQAEAALKIDGPMLILAGAGSGKTRAITYKIAHLVSYYNVEASHILAVTFTNKAAREMKGRIHKLLGGYVPLDWMGTFHSVCLRLLKLCLSRDFVVKAMGARWFDSNFSIYDDDDQKRLLKEILKADLGDDYEVSELKKVHGAISHFKNSVVYKDGKAILQTPAVVMATAEFADEERYARYYAEYQRLLRESNAMDFDDLLFNTVDMLQRVPGLANQLASRFQYVVVDEYQDTNDVQYELLKLLINEQKNVTVVGDDDQSIYGWRGANIKIIRNFHRDFAPVTIVKLERNYRSTSNIVQGAGSVIAHNVRPKEMEKVVYSKQAAGEPIRVRHMVDDRSEASQIADVIYGAGRELYSKTAVFYRTNAQSRALEKALNDKRIPCVIFGGMRFWDRKEVKDVLSYLRLLANEKDDAAYLRVINTPPRAIGKTTVENILTQERQCDSCFWNVLQQEARGASRAAAKLKPFVDLILGWKKRIAEGETPLPILVEGIIDDIGYKEFLRKDDELTADERIANVDEMINAIREFDEEHPDATLDSFIQDISLLTDADKKVDESQDHVTLMTIHMAKGLEFNTVHIAGCDEEIFPLIRGNMLTSTSERNEQLEEERRLFYVGCTRAEKKLYLYHAERRFYQGSIRPFAPSRFLKELDEAVVEFTPCINEGYSLRNSGIPSVNRSSMANSSIRKNDKHIVYKNSVVVKKMVPSEPRVVYDEYSENPFHPGVTVRHSKFGVGVITKCSGTGENAKVDVRFKGDGSVRSIVLKYAALEIIG
ncbi:MAG: UvrD-helicase domain-containing protein [Fibrobacteraceae bacterium]|nr:UvrD-helicase domain-containing protein [Fibrobacteraceae bacterium]